MKKKKQIYKEVKFRIVPKKKIEEKYDENDEGRPIVFSTDGGRSLNVGFFVRLYKSIITNQPRIKLMLKGGMKNMKLYPQSYNLLNDDFQIYIFITPNENKKSKKK